MTSLEILGTVLKADLLIVGGGMAGLACAITAKETDPEVDVLVVDKVVTGWGGKANKGGGNIVFVDPSELGNVLDFHVHNVGDFLEDQDLLMDFMRESRPDLERLESWGVHIYRDDAGEPKYVRWLPEHPWRLAVLDQDLTLNMAKHARKLGVRFKDRVEIIDLLKDGDRVCGAIGFGMIDGECVIAQAGAVVLANGNQCYKLMPRWASAGGEGIAAAYRAGAAMRGAEFGNFINWVFADTKEVCQGAEDVLYNAKGENISKRVRPTLESDVHSKEVVEWWKEMKAGNGPIVANMIENYVNNEIVPAFHEDKLAVRPVSMKFWGLTIGKAMAASTVHGPMQPVMPGLNAELAPVKVDHQMATTLPGLFAIGDTCYAGTCLAGAVPAPPGRMRGSGLGFATFSGARCAPAAVAAARAASGRPDAGAGGGAQGARLRAARAHRHGGARDGPRGPGRHGAGRLQHLQARRPDERGAGQGAGAQGAGPHAGRGRPALPGRLPRRRVDGARRRDVLPRLARSRGVPRLAPARGLPGARRRELPQVDRAARRRRRDGHLAPRCAGRPVPDEALRAGRP